MGAVVGLVPTIVFCGSLFRQGYLRRRPYWTARSWYNFSLLLCSSFSVTAGALAMAFGVDHGVYDYLTDGNADFYFYLLVTFAISGPSSAMGLLIWFARGRSGRPPGHDGGGAGVPARFKPRLPVLSASAAQDFPK